MTIHPALLGHIDALRVQQAMALIQPARRIALLAHERPDGDCLGSALGLTLMLDQLGKECVPVCIDPVPPDFRFLPGYGRFQTSLGDERFDLVIALDAGELYRYGALAERHQDFLARVPILNLDHHVSSNGCGQVSIIDTVSAATAELLVLFQQETQLPLTQDAAQCLLTGMITDTGSFQYSNTSARTMEAAAVLLEAGASPEVTVKPLFRTHPLAKLRLQAEVTKQAQTACEGRLIWSYANDETLTIAGATKDMDDGCVGTMRDVEGVMVAAFFKSYGEPQTTRLSLRTYEPFDAASFCVRLGGGGHPRAAGATINRPLTEAIAEVVALLEEECRRLASPTDTAQS
ncbi:DHH family phosphoesterase [Ktedonospora formicarum]|uniref:DHH family phosphoesterase n=1 Tax=Ktedonospora formicarum TaxID=2778364 RepID=A0A8J3HXV5_9CHLR|nr:bifunctional oligoribonuclease/PAP phosphatase NrnA [Ktedonospora formicarum]GHO45216.1 DHH family phosphoesterase [Ktedonospora formicarum]